MSNSKVSILETSLRRRIGRRLVLARWAALLLLPTLGALAYLAHRGAWFVYSGSALIVFELVAIMMGEAQRCPLCDASLVIGKGRLEEFANACPECGFLID